MPNFNSRETVRLVIDEYDKALNDPEVGRLVPRIIDRCVQVLDSALLAAHPEAEELYNQLDGIRAEYGYDQYSNPVSTRTREIEAIQSALTAHAKAKVEEAADRNCTLCPERDIADDGTVICESDWDGRYCAKRAAVLGKE